MEFFTTGLLARSVPTEKRAHDAHRYLRRRDTAVPSLGTEKGSDAFRVLR